jgi:uncharacterized protein YqgC (DUF456 family)
MLPIPYTFSEKSGGARHPSVSTQTSVYFAVNPSLAMFKGFASGCLTQGQVWKTQLSALSSYAPIRIWKIDPYSYCPVGEDGSTKCAPGYVDFVDVPGAFTDLRSTTGDVFDFTNCAKTFAVEVTGLEYLNEENIAVTILQASFEEYSAETGVLKSDAKVSHYKIMYLSTFSMVLSESIHRRDFVSSEIAQGQLCANMRRFPNIGSIVTETIAAWVNLLRPVIAIIVHLPGLIEIWRDGKPCSLNTHGHSILQQCGSEILSLDDFFDSVNRANSHFWSSFNLIAQAVRGLRQDRLANVVDGVAYYGAATSSPMGAFAKVITSVKIPMEEIGVVVTRTVFPQMPSAGLILSSNPVKMAQFSYGLVVGCIADIIPLSVRISQNSNDRDAVRSLVSLFMNRLFQARDGYYQSVTQGILQGCSGVSLIIGYDNPWAILLRRQCEAVPLSLIGLYDLVLAVVVNVPVAKCMCVDATQNGNFRKNAMDKCYFSVPTHMKPMVLALIEGAEIDGANLGLMCETLVEYAATSVKVSMNPWFSKQLQAADAISSSFDYLLSVFDVDAGRCTDFENNPFATVLIPEPFDYFASCGATTLCSLKCATDIAAFDDAKEAFQQSSTPRSVSGFILVIVICYCVTN